jgi:hypothetical protein
MYHPGICVEKLITTKTLRQESWPGDRDLKTGTPEHEAGVLSNGSDVQFVTVKAEAYSIAAT